MLGYNDQLLCIWSFSLTGCKPCIGVLLSGQRLPLDGFSRKERAAPKTNIACDRVEPVASSSHEHSPTSPSSDHEKELSMCAEEAKDAGLEKALRESEQEADMLQNSEVARAMILSKADCPELLNHDIVVARLTTLNQVVMSKLLEGAL